MHLGEKGPPVTRGPVVLVIPTLDEEASIGPLLAEVPRPPVARVIVADGGSTDATRARALAAGAEVIEAGRGYGRACLAGARVAPEDAILVFMDGDGADDPAELPRLLAPILDGTHDFVLAARPARLAEPGSLLWHQRAAGTAFGLALRALYGVRYTDMGAFRAIPRHTLLALDLREMTYGWNLEMQMKAARARLRILELPVRNRRRSSGLSKVAGSLRGTLRAGSRLLATLVRVSAQARPPVRGELHPPPS